MKPNFSLIFTDEGVDLLHRSGPGWQLLGSVSMSDPAFADRLADLQGQAAALEPGGLSTRLVLPNSQILYTTVEVQGPDGTRRRNQIKRALDGRTPYAVDDLAFDWSGDAPQVQVAVIARETLREAEDFARALKFNPITFAARPAGGQFDGEPDFGSTSQAKALVPEAEALQADTTALPIVGPDRTAGPTVSAAAEKESATEPGPEMPPSGQVSIEPAPAAPQPLASPIQTPDVLVSGALATTPTQDVPDAAAGDRPIAERAAANLSDAAAEIAPQVKAAMPAATASAADPTSERLAVKIEAPAAAATRVAEVPEAPAAFDVPHEDELALPPPALPVATFASRRDASRRDPPSVATTGVQDPRGSKTPSRPGPDVQGAAAPDARPAAPASVRLASLPPAVSPRPDLVAPLRAQPKPGAAKVSDPRAKLPQKEPAKSGTIARFVPLKQKASKSAKPEVGPSRVVPMTVANAAPTRNPDPKESLRQGLGSRPLQRGKPKFLGLILTVLLLLALAAAALWATYFAAPPSAPTASASPEEPTSLAEAEVTAPVALAPPAAALPEEVAEAPPESALAAAVAETEGTTAGPAKPERVVEALAEVVLPEPTADADPTQTTVAAADAVAAIGPEPVASAAAPSADVSALTGADSAAQAPGPAPLASAETTTLAPSAQGNDVVAALPVLPLPGEGRLSTSSSPQPLPEAVVAETDASPAPPVPPAPFGLFFDRDANGLVIATPEGALTPEGAIVFAGRPKVLPPTRSATPPAPPTPTVTTDNAEPPVFADPALSGFRPRSRPADLAGPQDETLLSVEPLIATAATVRPKARPVGLAPLVTVTADLQSALPDQASLASASRLAVTASRRPSPRPRDFAASVAAALATVAPGAEEALVVTSAAPAPRPQLAEPAAPKPEPEPAVVPPAEESDEEPELASVAPSIPTRASVAKQATERNAINLSKVNLIGVYGRPTDRHALVRLASGRYVKVKVGDRVDGGRVAAIGDQELRYVKDGRNLVLALPREG